MICDIVNVNQYSTYKARNGPFLVVFYQQDIDQTNYKIYEQLKSLEREFNDVPTIRFDYMEFLKSYPSENVPSQNYFLVIEKSKENKLYEINDLSYIKSILMSVREIRIAQKINTKNKEIIIPKIRQLPWVVYAKFTKLAEIEKFVNMPANMQYQFPNNTIYLCNTKREIVKKKKFETNFKKLLPQNTSKLPTVKTKSMTSRTDDSNKSNGSKSKFSKLKKFDEKKEIDSINKSIKLHFKKARMHSKSILKTALKTQKLVIDIPELKEKIPKEKSLRRKSITSSLPHRIIQTPPISPKISNISPKRESKLQIRNNPDNKFTLYSAESQTSILSPVSIKFQRQFSAIKGNPNNVQKILTPCPTNTTNFSFFYDCNTENWHFDDSHNSKIISEINETPTIAYSNSNNQNQILNLISI